ncbi:MAG: ATP-binding protein, partial [Mariprofundaceae bacterium]|nr:ATP-binding protein [Mariprofundaceae bacterium]
NLVIFEVEDNGCGMVAEQRERCLEPFYTTKPVGEGTGLGLSIVHSVVKEFNMGFEIVSGIGSGTTVRVEMEGVRG